MKTATALLIFSFISLKLFAYGNDYRWEYYFSYYNGINDSICNKLAYYDSTETWLIKDLQIYADVKEGKQAFGIPELEMAAFRFIGRNDNIIFYGYDDGVNWVTYSFDKKHWTKILLPSAFDSIEEAKFINIDSKGKPELVIKGWHKVGNRLYGNQNHLINIFSIDSVPTLILYITDNWVEWSKVEVTIKEGEVTIGNIVDCDITINDIEYIYKLSGNYNLVNGRLVKKD